MAGKPKTIDEYLAALSDDKRSTLEKLRKTIKATAPKAQECISYQLPAFRLNGRMLVAFGATANHCALYTMSSSTVEAHKVWEMAPGVEFCDGSPRLCVWRMRTKRKWLFWGRVLAA
jgi:Domain of unknown function (DU1801)